MEKALIKVGDKVTLPAGYGYRYNYSDFGRAKEDMSLTVDGIDYETYIRDVFCITEDKRIIRVSSQYLENWNRFVLL